MSESPQPPAAPGPISEAVATLPDLDSVRARLAAANDMVRRLCLPRDHPDTRDWTMSIPARPDCDPDLVIGQALHDAGRMLDSLPALLADARRMRSGYHCPRCGRLACNVVHLPDGSTATCLDGHDWDPFAARAATDAEGR